VLIAEIGADLPIKCVGGQNIYFTSEKSLWDAGGGSAGGWGGEGGGGGVEERGRGEGALDQGLLSGKYVVPVRGLPPAASRGGGGGGGGGGAAAAAADTAGAGEEQSQSQLKGEGEQEAAARGPPPGTPLPKCRMVCGGATHEHGHPADLLARVPRLHEAIESLLPDLSAIYSPLADPTKWTPVASVYGVRALALRRQEGRIPYAGRVTSTHKAYTHLSPPPPGGLWIFTGLGSRGLIHHSILAEHLATAILENDVSKLPEDVRQIALLREEESTPQS